MKKRTGFTRMIGFMICFFSTHSLLAQPFNLNPDVVPVELTWTEHTKEGAEKPDGRISVNKLTQDKDTMYYFVKDLDMYAPTYFSVNSSDPEADIKVNLCKENWHVAHRTGELKGKSLWKDNFKTEGDFGIMVIANKKPARYVLLVWTGNEMKVDMPSVFKGDDGVKGGGAAKGGGGKSNTLLIVAGIAVVAVIGFLVYKLRKKNAGGNTTVTPN